jgi:inward rectifier potassium channel
MRDRVSGEQTATGRGASDKAGRGRTRVFSISGRPDPRRRLIQRRADPRLDLYFGLLTMPWSGFFGVLAVFYFAFNVAFALLYLVTGDGIGNARPGVFADAFFFSVQTMATIGYGQMYPQSLAANLLVCLEVLLGMSGLALATGVIFARFSRPSARVLFSHVAVIAPHNGVPTLMFRAANQRRKNQILEAQVSVALLRDEETGEGITMRRFHDLPLVRARTPMFSLTWMVMHPIDEKSPLHGATTETLGAQSAEIVVALVGLDTTVSQTVQARYSYFASEIFWNRRFADIISRGEDGSRIIDYGRFHDLAELAADAKPSAAAAARGRD